jgi:zinc protease
MKLASLVLLCGGLAVHAAEKKFFPYPTSSDTLPNGLQLVTVQTGLPRLVALQIIVKTGSRNEIEQGKSGYAHLFEHMMFRGSEHFTPEQRDGILKKAGAQANAYTSDDRTVYHELFAAEDLDKVMELEADRFKGLKYSADVYKTETRAVLGEYNKNSANPLEKLYEVLRETAFKKHTYQHTTMGFIKDIEDMPNQYDYSLIFYNRYYRPEYATILLAGDVTRERALTLTRKYFMDWKRGDYAPEIPSEPPQKEPRTAHVDWPSPTLPSLAIAYHAPAYSDENTDKAALDFLVQIAFGEDSDLYKKLVLTEQKVESLSPNFDYQKDPELFTIFARVKDAKDVRSVEQDILATFKRFQEELIPASKLAETRSRLRYGTAMGWTSSNAIASFLAPFLALRGSVESVEKYYALYDRVTPEDVKATAAKYFKESNRTIVHLASKSNAQEESSK